MALYFLRFRIEYRLPEDVFKLYDRTQAFFYCELPSSGEELGKREDLPSTLHLTLGKILLLGADESLVASLQKINKYKISD